MARDVPPFQRLRRRRFTLACAGLAAGLASVWPADGPAAPIVVSGGGSRRTDCLAAWTLDLAELPSDHGVRSTRITCADGASCDVDGLADGQCTFRLQLCFGIAGETSDCTPRPVGIYDLRSPSRRAARRSAVATANRTAILEAVAALDQPIPPGSCTGDALIRVPLSKKKRQGKLVLRGRIRGADGHQSDTDVLRLACTPHRDGSEPARHQAFVLTTDFANLGSYSTIAVDPPRTVRADLGQTHSDAVGRAFGDRVYIVNRLGQDNVQVVDPTSGRSLSACSIGNGTNPQDIAVVNEDKAYVTRFQDGMVTIIDPTVPATCNGFRRGRIDLGGFADADGSPELGRMVIVGNRLYIAVLRLDRNRRFVPATRGLVAVVDIVTDTLVDAVPETPEVDAIQLGATNPFGITYDLPSDRIWVWESGSFFVTGDGGIEAIDPATNRTTGFVALEETLGGTVTAAASYSRERAFAVLADTKFNNSLIAFSPLTGERLDRLHAAATFLPDVAVNDGQVWLADRALRRPGVRIFAADSGDLLAGPIDVGLPPFDIVFLP
jgi:DNA-binding beta-propeller fold protein YncE